MAEQAVRFRVGQLVRCIELLTEGGVRRRAGFSPQLDLELASVQACLMVAAENGQSEVAEGSVAAGNGAAAAEAAPQPAYVPAPEDGSLGAGGRPASSGRDARLPRNRSEPRTSISTGSRRRARVEPPLRPPISRIPTVARDGDLVVFQLIYAAHRGRAVQAR